MNRLEFQIEIGANAALVYDIMLGLSDKSTYEAWTAIFNPTSIYSGNWEKGSKMHFLGQDEDGNSGGMLSIVLENILHQFVSLQTCGIVQGGQEIMDDEKIQNWIGGYENYTFNSDGSRTSLFVEIDVIQEYVSYFKEKYPEGLKIIKQLAELKV